MVQILPKVESFGSQVGKSLGGGLGQGFNESMDIARQEKLLRLENEALKKNYGIELGNIRSPDIRNQLASTAIARNAKNKQIESLQGLNTDPNQPTTGQKLNGSYTSNNNQQMEQLPENEGRSNQIQSNKPLVSGGNRPRQKTNQNNVENDLLGGYGKLFEPETKGGKINVLTPPQINQLGAKVAQEYNSKNPPQLMTNEEGAQAVRNRNIDNENYNAKIDSEKQAKSTLENKYGDVAENELLKVFPPDELNSDMTAWARKEGEKEAQQGGTEAEIRKRIANKANKIKKNLENIQRTPFKSYSSQLSRKLEGGQLSEEQDKLNFQRDAKPFLEMGMQDLLRRELGKRNYDPETREDWISNIPEGAIKSVNELPVMKHEPREKIYNPSKEDQFEEVGNRNLTPESSEAFENNLRKVLTENPNTNLILLRKKYNDSDVDWDEFNRGLNSLIMSGEFQLNPDQVSQSGLLKEPPLSGLQKFFKNLKIPLLNE